MIRRVTKRDGREAPFDKQKIEAAVRKAQVAVGEDDERFCKDVADVVELALERRFPRAGEPGGAVPEIEEIQDLVEQALIELGHAAVAKAYILYRDRRARVREALEVREERARRDGSGDVAGRLRVQESGALGRWSKQRIVAALLAEADLSRTLAEDVASAVEKRVFDSGLARISTSLIRELVDNELVEMGLAGALARQGPVAIARHDLRALLDDPGFEPLETGGGRTRRRLDEALAGLVLRRFALEDVLDERSAELHLAGDLDLCDLARPHVDLVRALPAELVSPGRDADAAFGLAAAVAPLLREVSCGIALEDTAVELAALARANELDRWVLALSAAARASGRRVDLVPFGERRVGARERAALVRLVEAQARVHAAAGAHGASTPRVFVPGTELEALANAGGDGTATLSLFENGLAAGLVVPIWERADLRFAGPGCRRIAGERGVVACSGSVALNLPRLARAAGPWCEERFLEGLCDLVDHALEALASLARFQRERQALRMRDFAARSGFAVAPVGLREALRWLGDGELRAEQGARVLGVLDEALRRGARRRGLSVALTPYFGEAARARFAGLDAERFHASQGLLFPGRGERAAPAPVAYSSGYDLAPPHAARPSATPGEAEGELVATVACGALAPLPALRPGARLLGEEHARVALWRRFEERRGAHKGSDLDRAAHAEPVLRFDHETAAATADEPTSCA